MSTNNDKECSHHNSNKRRKFFRRLFSSILIISFIILLIILLFWSILQPRKPTFFLKDATIFNFSVSAPALNILSTAIQVTIYSQNPNDHIGIYYQNSDVYATYKNQQITYKIGIPAVYQGQNDENVWSPIISGNNVPISPYNGLAIEDDKRNGGVWLTIKMDGRVKWKVGSLITGVYRLHVMCPAYIQFGNQNAGIVAGTGIKYQLSQECNVNV